MSKLGNIAEGWAKYILGGTPEQWAKDRLAVCISKKGKCFTDTIYPMCKECACHVRVKVLVKKEKCPLGKWKE